MTITLRFGAPSVPVKKPPAPTGQPKAFILPGAPPPTSFMEMVVARRLRLDAAGSLDASKQQVKPPQPQIKQAAPPPTPSKKETNNAFSNVLAGLAPDGTEDDLAKLLKQHSTYTSLIKSPVNVGPKPFPERPVLPLKQANPPQPPPAPRRADSLPLPAAPDPTPDSAETEKPFTFKRSETAPTIPSQTSGGLSQQFASLKVESTQAGDNPKERKKTIQFAPPSTKD